MLGWGFEIRVMAALANSLACGKYTTTDLLDRDFPKPPPARFFENLSIAQKKISAKI
jgi:hypothetical protein